MKPNAFDAFKAVPSPANAVRLAIADIHAANTGIDWPFIDALNKGADQLDDRGALLRLLERAADKLQDYAADEFSGNDSLATEINAKLATL